MNNRKKSVILRVKKNRHKSRGRREFIKTQEYVGSSKRLQGTEITQEKSSGGKGLERTKTKEKNEGTEGSEYQRKENNLRNDVSQSNVNDQDKVNDI